MEERDTLPVTRTAKGITTERPTDVRYHCEESSHFQARSRHVLKEVAHFVGSPRGILTQRLYTSGGDMPLRIATHTLPLAQRQKILRTKKIAPPSVYLWQNISQVSQSIAYRTRFYLVGNNSTKWHLAAPRLRPRQRRTTSWAVLQGSRQKRYIVRECFALLRIWHGTGFSGGTRFPRNCHPVTQQPQQYPPPLSPLLVFHTDNGKRLHRNRVAPSQ